MRIVFSRGDRGLTLATIYRPDGLVVGLPSYSVKHHVPHDLAHAVAERAFGLADGLFGSIASGAMFDNMIVVSGRQRHHAAQRSKQILRANKRALTTAELLAGVLHQAVEGPKIDPVAQARHDWGILHEKPFPWRDDQVLKAVATLRELADRWSELGQEETLEFVWPDRLVKLSGVGPRLPGRGDRT
jgi:hypothetical protein